jgi:hypothetical protein
MGGMSITKASVGYKLAISACEVHKASDPSHGSRAENKPKAFCDASSKNATGKGVWRKSVELYIIRLSRIARDNHMGYNREDTVDAH